MSTLIVADVGNSRVKWGRCGESGVVEAVTLSRNDPNGWNAQVRLWSLADDAQWAISGVDFQATAQLENWLNRTLRRVRVINSFRQLPIQLSVEFPNQVGLDRLFNAVAANARQPPDRTSVIVDAGSAITVDVLDSEGVFQGGAILPGLNLMARALHDHTANLPLVAIGAASSDALGTSTEKSIASGIQHAAAGGVLLLVKRLSAGSQRQPAVYVTGGDAIILAPTLECEHELWPHMTLEGIRMTAARML